MTHLYNYSDFDKASQLNALLQCVQHQSLAGTLDSVVLMNQTLDLIHSFINYIDQNTFIIPMRLELNQCLVDNLKQTDSHVWAWKTAIYFVKRIEYICPDFVLKISQIFFSSSMGQKIPFVIGLH